VSYVDEPGRARLPSTWVASLFQSAAVGGVAGLADPEGRTDGAGEVGGGLAS
jgi:hypothetical protein